MNRYEGLSDAESAQVDEYVQRARELRGEASSGPRRPVSDTVELSAWDRLSAAVKRWETVKAETAKPDSDYDDLRGRFWPPYWQGPGTPLGIPG